DRALDALVRAADGAREAAEQNGLANAHAALEQHVAAREDGDREEPDRARLADDDRADGGLQRERALAPFSEGPDAGVVLGASVHRRGGGGAGLAGLCDIGAARVHACRSARTDKRAGALLASAPRAARKPRGAPPSGGRSIRRTT